MRKRLGPPELQPRTVVAAGAYVCPACGAQFTEEQIEGWGIDGVGEGYGTVPVCTSIVEAAGNAFQVCRGILAAVVPTVAEPPLEPLPPEPPIA